jgi:hypothetical protein
VSVHTNDYDTRGPVETAVASPGFKTIWTRLTDSLHEMHTSMIGQAEDAARKGDLNLSSTFVVRAAQITDIISRLEAAPRRAVDQEKEKTHARPPASAESGYTGL